MITTQQYLAPLMALLVRAVTSTRKRLKDVTTEETSFVFYKFSLLESLK